MRTRQDPFVLFDAVDTDLIRSIMAYGDANRLLKYCSYTSANVLTH